LIDVLSGMTSETNREACDEYTRLYHLIQQLPDDDARLQRIEMALPRLTDYVAGERAMTVAWRRVADPEEKEEVWLDALADAIVADVVDDTEREVNERR
jgi:hypothetical protein